MKPTKEFAKAIVYTWLRDGTLAGAIARGAWGYANTEIKSPQDWEDALITCGFANGEFFSMKQRIQTWVAHHFPRANDCLWDGKHELAEKWIASGKDTPRPKARPWTQAKSEAKKDAARIRAVATLRQSGRKEMNAWHDWKTVK